MNVSEVMTAQVVTATPRTTIAEVAQTMAKIETGAVPITDDGKVVGLITDRDIVIRVVAEAGSLSQPVSEVMSQDVKYCFEDEDSAHVAQNMGELQVRRLPVLNREKRLVGIVSLSDLATGSAKAHAGEALSEIARPGGEHSQTRH